jgi:transglutaminase-like putative cysteine protease
LPLNFHITHRTAYFYDRNVCESHNLIKMFPIKNGHQKVLNHHVSVSGDPYVKTSKDCFGNKFGIFTRVDYHNQLIITSSMDVQTKPKNMQVLASSVQHSWVEMRLLAMDSSFRLFLHIEHSNVMHDIWKVVNGFNTGTMTPFNVVMAFSEYVYRNFTYHPGVTMVDTLLETVWNMKAGVCQDFSHVLIYMLRSVNIPARYVSGYICPNNTGMRGDAATHAWVEAFIPNYGWLGVDPTNNCVANEKHVRVAVGRDYRDVAPVIGEFKGNAHQRLEVLVTVEYEILEDEIPSQDRV